MAIYKTHKNKKDKHYGFLVSWDQKAVKNERVKGETKITSDLASASIRHGKKADSLAQAEPRLNVKKDIIRSLITISLVLILELVVYLAWTEFIAK